jgi:NAD(P)-dependent dehydrogenase (short-subunit alcohol dehydrogenase family)
MRPLPPSFAAIASRPYSFHEGARMNIAGQPAVVTGGASGLGEAVARLLASEGAKVSIFDLNAALGEAKAREIGGRFAAVDVTDEVAVKSALADAASQQGPARILVNCAGIGSPAKIIGKEGGAQPLAAFAKIVAVNLTGTFNVLSKFAARIHAAPVLGEERAVIVNTASVAAFDGQIGQAAYAASKGGLVAMTLPLARELARYGIRVMTIAPGIFSTPLLASLAQDVQDSLGRQVPFPTRLGRPHEFALLVQSIIVNPMLNGEVIRLDGAIRMSPK